MADHGRATAIAAVRRLAGHSVEFQGSEAIITLRVNAAEAAWLADHLPPSDTLTEAFREVAARLGSDG